MVTVLPCQDCLISVTEKPVSGRDHRGRGGRAAAVVVERTRVFETAHAARILPRAPLCPSPRNPPLAPCLQPFVVTLRDVEHVHFERVLFGAKNFDMVFIFKVRKPPGGDREAVRTRRRTRAACGG
jgi:hypothetical protein